MSEFKGAIFLSFIFVAIILPGILMFGIDSLHQNAFTKTTKEFSELVQEEAGLTEHVKMVKEELEKGGKHSKYSIRLIDSNGNEVTGTVPYGETITAQYEYTFGTIVPLRLASPKGSDKSESPFLQRTLKSSNELLITKRDALTKVTDEEGGKGQNTVTKTLKIKTNESKNRNQTQTFNIPNLGRITGVSVNTGSARIQSVLGDQLTFTFSNGSPSRKVQTGGEYKAGASKFVTNQTKAEYKDDEGYEGTLSKYVHSGELKMGQQKFVTNQTLSNYSDSEGYKGTLERYLYSGSYQASSTKYVTDYSKPDYVDEEGYEGKLTRYLVSGEEQQEQEQNKAEFFNGKVKPIKEVTAGTIVELNSKQYIVIDPQKGYLWMSENYTSGRAFDSRAKEYSASPFDPNSSSNIAYYLNNTFLKSLPRKYQDAIITHNWGTGHHRNERATTASAKIGLISYSEFRNISKRYNPNGFLTKINNSTTDTFIWSITRDANTIYEKHIHTITPSGYLNGSYSLDPKRGKDSNFTTVVRPAFYIDSSIELKVLQYNEDSTDNTPVYRYQGMVSKGDIDTRIYRYQGTVRKPAVDTRTYDNYYQYEVTITYEPQNKEG